LCLALTLVLGGLWGPNAALAQSTHVSEEPPVQILLIHHSCGGQLLAASGPKTTVGDTPNSQCIFVSHPNGGGLRLRLETAGFAVNEASYGSLVGQDTDIHHWHRKFRDHMDPIIRTRQQDEVLADGLTNRVVVFKSCYPNNNFVGPGTEPGDPDSPDLTLANARAAYQSLLPLFSQYPEVLFVAMTAPPLADPRSQNLGSRIKRWFSRKPTSASFAREFNTWLADPDSGWLAGYKTGNVATFDYYDLLTDQGVSDWAAYPTNGGKDSHPSSEGNTLAAEAFVQFLNGVLTRESHR